MNTAKAASMLGVTAATIGKYIRIGLFFRDRVGRSRRLRLAAIKTGKGTYLIDLEEVRDFRRDRHLLVTR